ncbi:MAG: hypothetical protein F6K09_29255 [Merismopedia sp. SIO2A8]|nr:hypothetical protein [Symploca sp. SIO2B6]NET52620.1 hypothetical protein [Merismopedia sp. SIO2A8]
MHFSETGVRSLELRANPLCWELLGLAILIVAILILAKAVDSQTCLFVMMGLLRWAYY